MSVTTDFVEFNRDLFFSNKFSSSPTCSGTDNDKPYEYTISTDCSKLNADSKKLTCEQCKNVAYAKKYDKSHTINANNLDIKERYTREFVNTSNLGIGILSLMVFIYYQI